MRIFVIGTAAALALGLAGCGGGGTASEEAAGNAADNVAAAQAETPANQLETMPEGQRNAVFIRAIRDAGEDCQGVESSTRSGEHQGMPVWTARCSGGGEWTIVVRGDTAAVLNPNEARLVDGNAAAPQNDQ